MQGNLLSTTASFRRSPQVLVMRDISRLARGAEVEQARDVCDGLGLANIVRDQAAFSERETEVSALACARRCNSGSIVICVRAVMMAP
jgi:hypothetical protein